MVCDALAPVLGSDTGSEDEGDGDGDGACVEELEAELGTAGGVAGLDGGAS